MLSPSRLSLFLVTYVALLFVNCPRVFAQVAIEEQHKFNHDIRCVIRTEHQQWDRTSETLLYGTVENLSDGPIELDVDPALYLSSRTSSAMGDNYWAPVDLLHDSPISTNKQPIAGGAGVAIQTRPIRLRFKNKGEKIDFRLDARHLLWAKTIWSGWPSSAFFSIVKADDYDLQLVLETDKGRVESMKVKLSVNDSNPQKQ
jgi:hypothetical protein